MTLLKLGLGVLPKSGRLRMNIGQGIKIDAPFICLKAFSLDRVSSALVMASINIASDGESP